LRLQAAITTQWLQIARNSLPNIPSTRYLVSIFTVRINLKPFLAYTLRRRNLPKFSVTSDVRYWVNQVRRCAAWLTGKKADLNWKLKISNTADKADITQSQARDIRHHRMQQVNSLGTDSRPIRAEYCIVTFHTIQPSSCHCCLSCKFNVKVYFKAYCKLHYKLDTVMVAT